MLLFVLKSRITARALRLLCLLLPFLLAPNPTGAQRYTFSTYGVALGLNNVNVTALLQAHDGTFWVATQKGVFIGDGTRFHGLEAFNELDMESPWAMGEDPAGRIWAVDGRHLVYWENGRVHPVPDIRFKLLSVKGVDLVSVPGQRDSIFLLHDGQLERIATTDQGKSWQASPAFSPDQVSHFPEILKLTSMAAGGGSLLWTGCGEAICLVDMAHETVRKYGPGDGLAPDTWRNLLVTRRGDLWVRGDRIVAKRSAGSTRFAAIGSLPNGSLNLSPSSLVEDPDGNIVLNLVGGVARCNGQSWRIFTDKNGLPQEQVDLIMFDRDGGLWFDLAGRGIAHWLGYGNWEGWTKEDGLSSNAILGFARDGAGQTWIATDFGLDRLDTRTGQVFKQNPRLPFHELTAVAARGTHIWTGDDRGRVFEFDPPSGRTRLALDHLDTVYQILVDKIGRVWVCSPKGLDSFLPSDQWSKPHHVGQSSLPPGNIYEIAEGPSGVLWVTTEKGLSRLVGDTWSAVRVPFQSGKYYSLMVAAAPDGTLWVQTRQPESIVHVKVTGRTAVVLSRYSDVLMASEGLGFMGFDQRGWLWIESDRGVQAFDGKRWVRCSSEDGLLWNNLDYPAFFADPDGSLWFGTSGGVSHLQHPERIFQVKPPEVLLTGVRLNDFLIEPGSQPEFDLRRPSLTAHLIGANYDREGAVVFRYRLLGLEDDWQEAAGQSLRFPALSPGRYTLNIEAVDRRTHLSSKPQSISFTVLEPWWNRGWFHLLEFLAAAGLILGLWRLSIHLLVLRQRVLTSLVASRTWELEQEKAELMRARSSLIEISQRDGLTGLLNRTAIFERLNALCDASLAAGTSLAVVMADLDHFKRINDEFGHLAGDTVIRECAARIRQTVRPCDVVGRYGGEELLILMPGLDPSSANSRMEQLRLAIAGELIRHQEVSLHITCSFGLAWMDRDCCSTETLVSTADTALYLAKQSGRNRVKFGSSGQ